MSSCIYTIVSPTGQPSIYIYTPPVIVVIFSRKLPTMLFTFIDMFKNFMLNVIKHLKSSGEN